MKCETAIAMLATKEKSHPGFQLPTAALHPGFGFAISNTALSFQASVYDFRGGPRSSGYFRDAETGLDYAKNRYHQPGMGRFLAADPYQNSAGPDDPGSWNRYAYVAGDPVNRTDRKGLYLDCTDDGDCDESDEDGVGGDGDDDDGTDTCPYNTCVNVTDTDPQLGLVYSPPVVAPNPTTTILGRLVGGFIRGLGGLATIFFASASTTSTTDTLYRPWDTAWVEENCELVGGKIYDPNGADQYPGGQSYEQEYECTDPFGNKFTVTIHTLTTKTGKIPTGRNRPHLRPGKPRGPKKPKEMLP